MATKQHKMLPLYLDAALYRAIEERGAANERDPIQEARWIIRQALAAELQQHDATHPVESVAAR